ncbi:MAG TPA: branched-chain amino acid ABC transporter permease [Ramlibacter sp.]|nr:branched-chain amino acid ABC transporter permease [Ramlibacter sp.]
MEAVTSVEVAPLAPAQASGGVRGWSRGWIAAAIVLVLVACVLPFVASNYRLFQFTMVLIYAIALLGLNIVTGYNGQVSLGHGAFYAIGAYATAILMDKFGVPYWLCIPAAGAICLLAGFLFGLPALRLEGVYLALATFALGVALPQLLKYKHLEDWTGGVQGIILTKPDPPIASLFGLQLNPDRWLFLFTLAVTVLMFLVGWNLLRGRVGRALIAIRDQPIAAATMGIDTAMYKSLAFGVSAMFTGVAGALGAIAIAFVAPDSFTIFLSISLVVGMVVGGLASITGAFWGAIFIQFVPNLADQISKAAPWALYGAAMIVFMYVMPTGIAGALRLAWLRIKRRRGRGSPAA